ncbi:hypothetical protein KP509_20G056500 [Ceratopteris richardii]|uniref:Transcription factor CBF/NF-Y/archaeal histone domain-containing protein n=1 Tax=Ceratopteris richardii TaxID=49495 RepID=A0A8T2SG92_CERRI|nr:hypothetical protein KP509_20G056500 [Ceratopteris richardii]KAH7331900.1 hypothetical protein KP509_20G056500 [Ceratopteris richardii]
MTSTAQELNIEPPASEQHFQPEQHQHVNGVETVLERNEQDEEDEDEAEGEEEEGHGTPISSAAATSHVKSVQPKKPSLNALAFPLARVKRLIKNDEDMRMSSEATYAIARAVGLFVEKFVEHSFEHMVNDRRHALTYKDLATHVSHAKRFQFLADYVPEKITAISALSNRMKEED